MNRFGDLRIISGTANRDLAERVAAKLGEELWPTEVSRFSDGEIKVQILQNIRGADVFIINPTMPPADNLLELLILIDAAKRASAGRITAVIPYFGYGRQDRKDQPRVPISAKLMANLIQTAGADRVVGIEFHAGQLQGFFDIPVDHLYAAGLITDFLQTLLSEQGINVTKQAVIVSPDFGAMKLGKALASRLGCGLAGIEKSRQKDGSVKIVGFLGPSLKGKVALLIDDMISTASTIATDCTYLLEKKKSREVYVGATHPLLVSGAMEKLEASGAKKVVVTNTIPLAACHQGNPLIHCLDVSDLLRHAIKAIHEETSVTSVCFQPVV